MEFCPDCGTRLVAGSEKKKKKIVFSLACPKCGYKKKTGDKPPVVPKAIERPTQESIAIIGKKSKNCVLYPQSG